MSADTTPSPSAPPTVPRRPRLARLTPASPLLAAGLPAYLTHRGTRKDSPNTTAAISADVRVLATHLAAALECTPDELALADLTRDGLRAAFADYAVTHAAASIGRAWSTWNGLCTFLVAEDVAEGNPMSGVDRPRAKRPSPKALRGEDTGAQLLAALAAGTAAGRDPWPQRDLAILAVLLVTGLRSAELTGLRVGDVHGPAGERRLHVRGKGNAERSVPIEAALEDLVEDYLATRRVRLPRETVPLAATAPLFVDRTGRALARGQLQYLVRQAYRNAGVGDRVPTGALVHALRHTFATRVVASGASAVEAMRLLGHQSLTTTQRYVDASALELRHAAAGNAEYDGVRTAARNARPNPTDPTERTTP